MGLFSGGGWREEEKEGSLGMRVASFIPSPCSWAFGDSALLLSMWIEEGFGLERKMMIEEKDKEYHQNKKLPKHGPRISREAHHHLTSLTLCQMELSMMKKRLHCYPFCLSLLLLLLLGPLVKKKRREILHEPPSPTHHLH